jgi:hypothetical protein
VKQRDLSEQKRERDIRLYIDVARQERLARGLDAGCADLPPAAASPARTPRATP